MATQDNEVKKALQKISEYYDENCVMIDLNNLLESQFGKLKYRDIPAGVVIVAFDEFCNQWVFNDVEKKGYIHRTKAIPYYDWNHKYSVKTFGLKLIEVIKSWSAEGTVALDEGDNDRDGENFYVWYFVKIDENATLSEVISYDEKIEKILESQTEALLSKGELSQDILNNEVSFSLGVLLPLLRKMGYENPQYNHGPREFGKDIIFSDIDKLGIRRNFSLQVKVGDVSGEASGQLDKIIAQVDDALKMSYNDIYSQEKRFITDVLIVITGRFVGNAKDKICEKLKNNNVHFMDIDKIQSLIAKYVSE
jgi:hypothetical protein